VLQRLHVYLPDDPPAEAVQGALSLVAGVVARYTPAPITVDVRRAAGDEGAADDDGPFARSFLFEQAPEGAAEIVSRAGTPALRLSGDAATLPAQVRLLTDQLGVLAVDAQTAAGGLAPHDDRARVGASLGELGAPLTAAAPGAARVRLPISQESLGHAARSLELRLAGTHTPIPIGRAGLFTARAGDAVIDSWPADAEGTLQHVLAIPDEALRRTTDLSVTLATVGGGCGADAPLELALDPQSRLRGEPADGAGITGFHTLPAELRPGFLIAAAGGGFDDARRALLLLSGLAALSDEPLAPVWTTVDRAVKSARPSVLIAAGAALPESVRLPLNQEASAFSLTYPDGSQREVALAQAAPYAALHSVWDGRRQLLVAETPGSPDELDRMLGWLDADRSRWERLEGDVLFTAEDREPVPLSVHGAAAEAGRDNRAGAVAVGLGIIGAFSALLACLVAGLSRQAPWARWPTKHSP
jgi:hypothetical protein